MTGIIRPIILPPSVILSEGEPGYPLFPQGQPEPESKDLDFFPTNHGAPKKPFSLKRLPLFEKPNVLGQQAKNSTGNQACSALQQS
jgi:hypothetical protein